MPRDIEWDKHVLAVCIGVMVLVLGGLAIAIVTLLAFKLGPLVILIPIGLFVAWCIGTYLMGDMFEDW